MRHKDNIDLIHMLIKFNDCENFSEDSHVWHCKSSHFNESPFKEEYKKYLNMR